LITLNATRLWSALRGAVASVRQMWRLRIDTAIDLEFFARSSAALCFLSGASRRVGYHAFAGEASYRGDLMTHRLSFNPYLHTSQAFGLMVQALDQPASAFPQFNLRAAPLQPAPGRFEPPDDEVLEVRRVLQGLLGSNQIGPLF